MVICEDNDGMLHKVAFNLCLHCLLRSSGTEIHHFIVLLSGRVLDSRPTEGSQVRASLAALCCGP